MGWKVLMTAGPLKKAGQQAQALLQEEGCDVRFVHESTLDQPDKVLAAIEGVDAVMAGVEKYPAEVLDSSKAGRLKILSRWGVGCDSIDLKAATRLGIVVTNTPGMLNEAVADYTFALLLSIARRISEAHISMREGDWSAFWGHDIAEKTLGIIGCGSIGRAVARRAGGFNMRLLGYDLRPDEESRQLGIRFVTLEELLSESDFVCLHAALTSESKGMINDQRLRLMKRDAILINTARGALVEESALLRALKDGWIAGAALDAFAAEPLAADHPLRQAPNILLTPHQASYGRDTGEKISLASARAVVDLLHGKKPAFPVNPDVFKSDIRAGQ